MKRLLFGMVCAMFVGTGFAADLAQMQREYDENQVVFQKKYAGKSVEFTARIDGIKPDVYTTFDMMFNMHNIAGLELNPTSASDNIFPVAIATMKNDDDLDGLKRGQKITLRCDMNNGENAELSVIDLHFKNCVIVK